MTVVHCTYGAIFAGRIAAHFTLSSGVRHFVRATRIKNYYQIVRAA